MRNTWLLLVMLTAAGCASSPSVQPSERGAFTGNFGGNAFDTRTVSGPAVSLARDAEGKWSGTIPCRWRLGRPTGKVCPFFWEPKIQDGLPSGIGAPSVGEYQVVRVRHSILFRGDKVEYQFAAKVDRDFPPELVAPLFFAVANTTDPGRDLLSSEPPLGITEFTNPDTRLVWLVSVDGLGDVSIRRGPVSSPVEVKPGSSGAIIYHPVSH
jgi:hypothetical protein